MTETRQTLRTLRPESAPVERGARVQQESGNIVSVALPELRSRLRSVHPNRITMEAAERVLDGEHTFLDGAFPGARRLRLWEEVVMLLTARSLQLQRASLDLATIGYGEEIQSVARAMLSAVMVLTAIGHGRSHTKRDGKAVRYLTFGRRARKRQLRYLAQSRWITRETRLASDAEYEAEEAALLKRAAKEGITPTSLGGRREREFWSGYTDRDLFKKMKAARWYHHYYAPWSETSHGAASALVAVSEDYDERRSFDIGPHHRSPWFVLFAVSEFGIQVLIQVNRLFRLHRTDDIRALDANRKQLFHAAALRDPKSGSARLETSPSPESVNALDD